MTRSPTFRTRRLSPDECVSLLERRQVGRLAYTLRDRVDIRPLGYVHRDGWLFGRTEAGEKTETLLRNRWVAFQVDEVEDPWNWSSVVVHGAFHHLLPGATGEEERVREQAMAALGETFPGIFSARDPASHRNIVFGISVQDLSGVCGWLDPDGPDGA
jgi:uncharacterized protein